jgi:hypothetical protein
MSVNGMMAAMRFGGFDEVVVDVDVGLLKLKRHLVWL